MSTAAHRLRQQRRRWAERAGLAARCQPPDHAVQIRPDGMAGTDAVAVETLLSSSSPQRLAYIDRRLAELRQARSAVPADDAARSARRDTQQRAREALLHRQECVARVLEAQQRAAEAFAQAASAHDRAAEANERAARAGIGDVAEHNRMAAYHRAAANADRQHARAYQADRQRFAQA